MTTRRIYKKELQRAASETIEALEKVLRSEVSNKGSIIKVVDAFIRGERLAGERDFMFFPLANAAFPNGTFHIVFECWPLRVILRANPGAADMTAVEREYQALRSHHHHVEVRFREIAHGEMKSSMTQRVPTTSPTSSREPPQS